MAFPTYDVSSKFFGSQGRKHKAIFPLQPKGGDYGQTDFDSDGGVAQAWADGVVLIDPVTGKAVSPAGTTGSLPTAVTTGQLLAPVTAGGTALGAALALTQGVLVKALSSNTGTVYVGPTGLTSGTGFPLAAGEEVSVSVADRADLFILGNGTDTVAYLAN